MAHGFLSYQDTRGEVDYLGKIGRAIKNRLKKTGKKDKKGSGDVELKDTPDGVEPVKTSSAPAEKKQQSLAGSIPKGLLKGSGLSKLTGSSPRALGAGAAAVTPEVMGGALTRFSRKPGIGAGDDVFDTTATRVVEPAGSLQGVGELIVRSNNNVVEAVMGLQQVTVRVIDSVENLGRLQAAIADKQMQQQMLLATRAEVAAEKRALSAGSDLSGGITADEAGQGPSGKGGGFINLLGDGMDLMGGRYMRRGPNARRMSGARRRLAGRTLRRAGLRAGTKAGTKSAAKIGAKALGKGLLKKIPLLGLGAGALFAAERAMAGDFTGAGLELASGAASTVPGFGTAASVGIDAALAGRDMGLTPFANGGIITQPTASLMGEKGDEGVFPLEGAKGKQTFLKFGEGILEAQKKNKRESAKRMAEGLAEYYDKQNGWEKFMEALKNFIKGTPLKRFFNWGDDPNDERTIATGGTAADSLFATISGGEGGVDSVNRGTAGDTPGGIKSILGKSSSELTVDEIDAAQRADKIFAVGKYQITPVAMPGFKRWLKSQGIDTSTAKFNEATQDKFKEYVINVKRPQVGKFLRGEGGVSLEDAQMALAAEFASVGVPRDMKKGEYGGTWPKRDIKKGESLYSGVGGNAASISPEVIAESLTKEKEKIESAGENPIPPSPEGEDPGSNKEESSKEDWTKKMSNFGFNPQKDGRKFLNLGNGVYASIVPAEGGGYRWQIYKNTWGGRSEYDTEGANESFKPLLEEAGKRYMQQNQVKPEQVQPLNPGDQAAAINAASQQLASAGATTVINNNYFTGKESPTGGNSPGNIAFGIGMKDTGADIYSELSIRSRA